MEAEHEAEENVESVGKKGEEVEAGEGLRVPRCGLLRGFLGVAGGWWVS